MALAREVDKDAPFFPPDSAIRRIHEEGILVLGGGRALLMQIAHPLVARGVAEHSTYRRERAARLLRTLRATFSIVFGSNAQAEAAAARMNQIHGRVSGTDYNALDPDLLVWVIATLIDTTFEMHERFVGPVPEHDAADYYNDAKVIGSILCIPDGRMPADVAALRAYVAEMSASLSVSDTGREIARELLAPLPGTGPAMLVGGQLTAGLLHPHLREGFGLAWGPVREAQLRTMQAASRALLPKLPRRLRRPPAFVLPPRASTQGSR